MLTHVVGDRAWTCCFDNCPRERVTASPRKARGELDLGAVCRNEARGAQGERASLVQDEMIDFREAFQRIAGPYIDSLFEERT